MPSENELAVLRAARNAGIRSPAELANLMAQLGHESGGFTRLEESFRYSRGIDAIPVRSAFREGRPGLEEARQAAMEGRPQELARLMYGGRMGNDDAGDGYRYRGRGFTMLTGEQNYRDAGAALGLDLVRHPELAAERDNAARIALWFWRERVPAHQREDVSAAAAAINGGENGLADRHDRFDAWQALLTPGFLADLDAGRVRAGASVGPATPRQVGEDGELRRLERGAGVSELQRELRRLDVRDAGGRPVQETGVFDARTEQAVRAFQRAQGDVVTGRVDARTQRAIEDAPAGSRGRPVRRGAMEVPGPGTDLAERLAPEDVRLLSALRSGVEALDRERGRTPDELSERLAWSLLAEAKSRGISRADHVVLSVASGNVQAGENVFVVQGGLDDPGNRVAWVKSSDALSQSLDVSLERIQAASVQPPQVAQTMEQVRDPGQVNAIHRGV